MTQRVKILLLIGLLLILGTQVFFGGLEPDDSDLGLGQTSSTPTVNDSQDSLVFSMPKEEESVELASPRNIFATLAEQLAAQQRKNAPAKIAKVAPTKPKPRLPVRPPPPPPRPVQPPGPSPEELARAQAERELTMAKLQAEREMNQYRFIGYLEKSGEHHAFLSNGDALYIVKQGELVDGSIKLKTIEEGEVVLSKVLPIGGTIVETTLLLTKDNKGT